MIILYNVCQLLVLFLAWPALVLLILLKPKYRKSIPSRLGIGLKRRLSPIRPDRKTVWIHALSVGEVTSAHPLVAGLRRQYPQLRIIVTASTRTGLAVAEKLLSPLADSILPSPVDLQPTVIRYIRLIQPDLFILIETDFWPNLLNTLHSKGIPTILANGRISQKSFSQYARFALFFRPLFQSFSHLLMQTDSDRINMEYFGVKLGSLHCSGNLKYDTAAPASPPDRHELSRQIPARSRVFLAGSTHKGEEDIILSVYGEMKKRHPDLFLIVAPRDPARRTEIGELAAARNLSWQCRSERRAGHADLLILDTMGELPGLYPLAEVAFVGGSLVSEGGHNPIEPARAGIPVLFGRHMEDFAEVSRDLLLAGGGIEVSDLDSLQRALTDLLASEELRVKIGNLARVCIDKRSGVVDRHLELIGNYL